MEGDHTDRAFRRPVAHSLGQRWRFSGRQAVILLTISVATPTPLGGRPVLFCRWRKSQRYRFTANWRKRVSYRSGLRGLFFWRGIRIKPQRSGTSLFALFYNDAGSIIPSDGGVGILGSLDGALGLELVLLLLRAHDDWARAINRSWTELL